MTEGAIQNSIRIALSKQAFIFRINVGTAVTQDGRIFSTGVPNGFPDLFGVRKSDGKAFFIEVKTPKGRVRPAQEQFIKAMKSCGVIAGIARSVEDAIKIIGE